MKTILKQATFFLLWVLFFIPFQTACAQDKCAARPVAVQGNSLTPMVPDGSSVMMKPLSCAGKILRGDLVIFRTGACNQPVIKIVKALPGDRFAVKNGYISVNDGKLTTSTGEDFRLAESRARMLALYEKRFNGVIPPDSYLVLGDNPSGALDSTRIGLVHRSDIIMVGNTDKSNNP